MGKINTGSGCWSWIKQDHEDLRLSFGYFSDTHTGTEIYTAMAHKNALNKICHINLAIYMFVFGGECAACSSPKNVIYRPNALESK